MKDDSLPKGGDFQVPAVSFFWGCDTVMVLKVGEIVLIQKEGMFDLTILNRRECENGLRTCSLLFFNVLDRQCDE